MRTVRCPTCHRRERWSGDEREVVTEGGARRPAGHAELAAWEVLYASHRGKLGPVVGPCPACGLPMVTDDAEAAPVEWVVRTPEGEIAVKGHGLHGPNGPIVWSEAAAIVQQHYGERMADTLRDYLSPMVLVRTLMVGSMAAPFVLWLAAAFAIVLFLAHFASEGPLP